MKINNIIKILIIVCIILIIILFIIILGNLQEKVYRKNFQKYITNITGIDVRQCSEIANEDTHEGFPADGDTFIVWDCSNNEIEINKSEMLEYPLSEKLSTALYETKTNEKIYAYSFAEKHGIPKIQNGFYYFYDDYCEQYKDMSNCKSDEKIIEERYSHNFTFIAYDNETKKLYYLEVDT